jgi:uroporphyrinogen decarboxylase
MTKRERVFAALARRPVDHPPIAMWRHAPDRDHDPRLLADAMLTFCDRWRLDLIKVMSSGVYCVEDWGCKVAYTGLPSGAKQCTAHAVTTSADWSRLRPLDPGAGALGRELEAVHLIAKKRADDAPILHTVFSPLTVARKLAGDRLAADMRTVPGDVHGALEVITATLVRYAATAFEAGADGIFFATQMASAEVLSADEHATWDLPYARRVIESLHGRSSVTLLHLHGTAIFFDALAVLPVHAINWHDRRTAPTLADAHQRFRGAVVGGLDEQATLRTGPAAAVTAEVHEAIRRTDGVGVIIAPGCGVPLDVPDAHIEAAVRAARDPAIGYTRAPAGGGRA